MPTPRIAIVGTGAIGASLGADLTEAGLDVTYIEQWPAHVEAMRAHGVQVTEPAGTRIVPVRVHHLCEVAELRAPFDVVLVVVKAYDTRWACELIKPLVKPDGVVVGLQNGMTVDDIADIMGPRRTVGAVVEIAANMHVPGRVHRETPASGTWFGLGIVDPSAQGCAERAAEVLKHTATADVVDDIRSAKWMKLVGNAAEFLPSAILDLPLLTALRTPGVRRVADAAGKEALDTALALGHRIVPIFGQAELALHGPDTYAAAVLDAICEGWSTADTRVALLQDWGKGRRGEIDEINGLVVQEQARLGGSAPVNAHLADLGHRIERGELRPSPDNLERMLSVAVPA